MKNKLGSHNTLSVLNREIEVKTDKFNIKKYKMCLVSVLNMLRCYMNKKCVST